MTAFMWAVTAALVWGVVPLLERAGLRNTGPVVGLFYRSIGIVIGLVIMVLFILSPREIRDVDIKSVLLLILGGFLASFVAQIAFYQGLRMGNVSTFVPVAASYPLVTFILGVIIFKEPLTAVKTAGVILIIAGIWCIKGN